VEEDIKERAEENWDYHFPVVNQQFCLLSIVDTESKDTCAAVKIFGCYPTEESANAAAKKISAECDFFHVYVCPTNQESRMTEIQEAFVALKERKAKEVIRHLEKEEMIKNNPIIEEEEEEEAEEK